MVLVGAVSLVIFGAVGIVSHHNAKSEVDRALSAFVGDDGAGLSDARSRGQEESRVVSGNSVPVYCVVVDGDGSWRMHEDSTAQMDDALVDACVRAALDSKLAEGTLDDFGVFFRSQDYVKHTYMAFADAAGYYDGVLKSYLTLLGLWVLLMLAVLAITVFLSNLVTEPVAQAWEDQQRFIADASHELKTPLTVIMADASILATNPDKTVGEQQQWVDGIATEAAHMQQLTEEMLTLAQAEAATGKAAEAQQLMSQVDLSDLVESSLLQFEAVAFERGLMIDEDIDEDLAVNGDEMRLERLLKTLLENACKYSVKPGTIEVGLHRVKGDAVLAVRNEGDPIDPEDLPHVFDRFYRSDKSRVREGETASFGLGLSIAKSTVDMHGGTIRVDSDEGGTTFTVTLPLLG